MADDAKPGTTEGEVNADLALDADLITNAEQYAAKDRLWRLGKLAAEQGEAMEELLSDESASKLLRWPMGVMDEKLGPLRGGTIHIIGARPGNGKTTLMMNTFQSWVDQGKRVLYCGMEMAPEELRLQWAAWACDLEMKRVMNREWAKLPPDARDRLRAHRDWQVGVCFDTAILPSDSRLSLGSLVAWVRDTVKVGVEVVVIDHLHRMDWGDRGGGRRQGDAMAEGITQLKELAKYYSIPIVIACQLNRPDRDVLGMYQPPPLESLKETGAIEQEADVVLMGYRALIPGVTEGDMKMARMGMKPIKEMADDSVLALRIAKHRLDGDVLGDDIYTFVHGGRLYEDRLVRDRLRPGSIGAHNPIPAYDSGNVLAWTLKQVDARE